MTASLVSIRDIAKHFVIVSIVITTCIIASDANASPPEQGSEGAAMQDDWMPSEFYQRSFDARVSQNLIPVVVEARVHEGLDEYRAKWQKRPDGCDWISHNQLTKTDFDAVDAKYQRDGFTVSFRADFIATDGTKKYQVVWTKGCSNK